MVMDLQTGKIPQLQWPPLKAVGHRYIGAFDHAKRAILHPRKRYIQGKLQILQNTIQTRPVSALPCNIAGSSAMAGRRGKYRETAPKQIRIKSCACQLTSFDNIHAKLSESKRLPKSKNWPRPDNPHYIQTEFPIKIWHQQHRQPQCCRATSNLYAYPLKIRSIIIE